MGEVNKFIWLFGENRGNTANNNSYYFWKNVVNIRDEINKFIVFDRNEHTLNVYNNLTDYEKKFVVWKNTAKHFELYYLSDLIFVSLSFRDVVPQKLWDNSDFTLTKSLIHLNHGTTGIKKIGYNGKSYWNNLFRYITYNPQELINNNGFAEYQLKYVEYPPRYCELIKKDEAQKDKNQILWFLTWREYFELGYNVEPFIKSVNNVLKS